MSTFFTYFADVWQWIFGAGGLVTMFMYYGLNKRAKRSEVTAAEFANFNSIIDGLQKQVDRLQSRLDAQDLIMTKLYGDKAILELKNSQKKSAINCAPRCTNTPAEGCPVLLRMEQIEDDYLDELLTAKK